ncbi:MAG: hypothetical protein KC423_11295 [Anaerolineales bacterium]|nr:hypothetical protein [Anaerolineales bacterium]MCB9433391.1 hypothetical protein [Ardenticatenaceae bacterium]
MIGSELGHAAFRIGMYLVVVAGLLTWFTETGTPGNAISQFTLILGILFLVIVTILVRVGRK